MIKIYPRTINNTSLTLNNNKDNTGYNIHSDCISFKGCGPSSSRNSYRINKIVNVIKLPEVQKIAVLLHKRPDLDAIGTALGAAPLIEKTIGKKVDIFVLKPLTRYLKQFDKRNEIKVINEIFNKVTENNIVRKFGSYDAAIGIDIGEESLFEKILYDSIFTKATWRFIIDHHIAKTKNSNNIHVNMSDANKESAAQVLMEFITPLGLKQKDLTSDISTPLMAAVISDSGQFTFVKTPQLFKDATILSETADTEKIIRDINSMTAEEFDEYTKIINKKQLAHNNKIVYFNLNFDESNISDAAYGKAMYELGNIDTVKYIFSVKERGDVIKVSLRSKNKSIEELAEKLGGGGHSFAAGAEIRNKTIDEVTNFVIKKLIKLDKS